MSSLKKYSFRNDYSEGAHPQILKALVETNLEQTVGYGEDRFCLEAAELIKGKLGRDDVDIHLIPGGTQTNLIAISAFLRPHEAVIAPLTGHIEVHETGAIEATGHKIITMEGRDGKLSPSDIEQAVDAHTDEHMVKPRLVYISNATEVGSIYTKAELEALSSACRQRKLLLFMDGARLGSALTSRENDLTLSEIANLVDAFYIGGTKNGALIGEALVICTDHLKEDFRFHIKQKGALLAKGRLLGIQFRELFRDNLFFDLAEHANTMAEKIQDALLSRNCPLLLHSPSNQIFPVLPNRVMERLAEDYSFEIQKKVDADHTMIRLVTSWATREDAVDEFIADLKGLL
ncbi:MAG: aminotransferase class I/II-fold pyridoxal phosphate-dependent enzyme [Firmicutes bacterium]|nr:aminotransferase class I/II-fold pyridoxal phosphate-dependent enzyme [Bacillota bacterium]